MVELVCRWIDSIPLKAALHFHAGHFGWMQGDYDFRFRISRKVSDCGSRWA